MTSTQPAQDSTDEFYPHVYEQSLDRLACALGGKELLPHAFQCVDTLLIIIFRCHVRPARRYIPAMLKSHEWRIRHAGIMAVAVVGEGTHKVGMNRFHLNESL